MPQTLSLVDHLLFKNLFTSTSRNLCLYDVDKDGDNELVIGFWDSGPLTTETGEAEVERKKGSIVVIKNHRIWQIRRDIDSMILCITAGFVVNRSQPWILALGVDSHCFAFNACHPNRLYESDLLKCHATVLSSTDSIRSDDPSIETHLGPFHLNLIHRQQLAYNAKDICLINSGDACEIAVAYSDRVVRLYTWLADTDEDGSPTESGGQFVILIKWTLAGQLIASQPGGAFVLLQRKFEKYQDVIAPTLIYYPPHHQHSSSSTSSDARTWIVGNVRTIAASGRPANSNKEEDERSSIAICVADGTIVSLDPSGTSQPNKVIWTSRLPVKGELFGLSKISLTNDSSDQLCACAWDGTTYVWSCNAELYRFALGQSCQAFTAGSFAVRPGVNEPVLVHTTCDHTLVIHFNIQSGHCLSPTATTDFIDSAISDQLIASQLKALGISLSDRSKIKDIISTLLYEYEKHTPTELRQMFCSKVKSSSENPSGTSD